MIRRPCPPSIVRLAPVFSTIYNTLNKRDSFKEFIDYARERLKEDRTAGIPIAKKKIPRFYLEEYGVNNLYLFKQGENRLTYTLLSNGSGSIEVIILEAFSIYKEYKKRFGYKEG